MLHAGTIPRLFWGVLYRLATMLVVAGCGRLHFDAAADAPVDAAPLALACNTPVHLVDAPVAAQLGAVVTSASVIAGWIDDTGLLGIGIVEILAPDQALAQLATDPLDTGYTVAATAASGDRVVAAYTQNGTNHIEVLDASLHEIGSSTTTLAVLGSHAVAMTGATTGVIAAVTGNDTMTNRAAIVPVNADGMLGTPVDDGAIHTRSSLVNIGDALAIVNAGAATKCGVETIGFAITAHGAQTGWGTAGDCSQPLLGYSPGRLDALLVRHDVSDNDLNHVIATRAGATYTIPGESRLQSPANEPRIAGVADGYWVTYETNGQLAAVHVDVTGAKGTLVPLGPLSAATAQDVVVTNGEAYAIWVQDGLELAHLCE
jgi:hypothetical protein